MREREEETGWSKRLSIISRAPTSVDLTGSSEAEASEGGEIFIYFLVKIRNLSKFYTLACESKFRPLVNLAACTARRQ